MNILRGGTRTLVARLTIGLGLVFSAACGSALADNQTPTVSPVLTDTSSLPYTVRLRKVDGESTLPTLQSFSYGQVDGLWVLIGGRTSGLHNFTNNPIRNFPPRRQNNRIWVIDPATGQSWSRLLANSSLTADQVDGLSATAAESMQVGNVLYVVGGYGYKRSIDDFVTYDTMTAFNLRQIVSWVQRDGSPQAPADLADIIRQVSHPVLKVTGGQMSRIGNRTILAFGQMFDGGYGAPDFKQVYTTQVRSFRLVDNGRRLAIRDVRRDPTQPNPTDYRRRDYTMVPYIEVRNRRRVDNLAALAGVFTTTDGMFTVPVEIDGEGAPTMADPDEPATFKQAMNGYDSAYVSIWDGRRRQSHAILFGGISYVFYNARTDTFVEDPLFPFINDITAVVRGNQGKFQQYLLGSFPRVMSADRKRLRFGAEAHFLMRPTIPTTRNGMIDLMALKARYGTRSVVVGQIFGGIAADGGNGADSTASNLMFNVVLTPR